MRRIPCFPAAAALAALLAFAPMAQARADDRSGAQGGAGPAATGCRLPAAPEAQKRGAPSVFEPPPSLARPGAGAADPSPAAEEPAAPPAAGASGRRADPPPAAPASPAEAPEWFWRNAEIAQAFECPVGPIARMLEAAQGTSEFSPALEVEREVLVLCRDRWTVLKKMMDAELALAAVLRRDSVARERLAIELEELRGAARARIEGARRGAQEAARDAAARELRDRERAEGAAAVAAPAQEREPEERYGWFAMTGSGTDLRAAVTDGAGRWWVRAGDSLPGDVRIAAVRARPPRVMVMGGSASGLPYRPWRR